MATFKSVTPPSRTYHGSGTPGLQVLAYRESRSECTAGEGVYLTSDINAAMKYAVIRSSGGNPRTPVVYEARLEGNFLDLRAYSDLISFLKEAVRPALIERLTAGNNLPWSLQAVLEGSIETIDRSEAIWLNRLLTQKIGSLFNRVVISQGFDALVIREGGEMGGGIRDNFNHDSWVVLEPREVITTREILVTQEEIQQLQRQ